MIYNVLQNNDLVFKPSVAPLVKEDDLDDERHCLRNLFFSSSGSETEYAASKRKFHRKKLITQDFSAIIILCRGSCNS